MKPGKAPMTKTLLPLLCGLALWVGHANAAPQQFNMYDKDLEEVVPGAAFTKRVVGQELGAELFFMKAGTRPYSKGNSHNHPQEYMVVKFEGESKFTIQGGEYREYRIVPGEKVPGDDLPHERFLPLGKVERLRGEMAFAQEQFEQGLRHYVLAYICFVRFSPDAVEKDNMLESLYNHLRDLPVELQQELVESVSAWTQQYDAVVDTSSFVQILKSLLGV